ncbi:MAG: glycosyltransferase family 9 protein [Thiotrichales bacterium]|nr:MAG: glycosyltransferase family 9 protein [Thiotrichales bacterium]
MNIKAAIIKRLARKTYKGQFNPENFRQILIVRPAKIGDTICLLPLIRELKKALPSAEIDIYASTDNNFMFRFVPQVRHVYTRHKRRKLASTLGEIFRMRANHYDLIIDTMDIRLGKVLTLALINADWLIANSGFQSRYGLDNSDLPLYYRLNRWKLVHTTDRLLEYLDLLGIEEYDSAMEFSAGEEASAFASSFLKPHRQNRLIGFNADASNPARSVNDSEIIDIFRGIRQHDENIKILLFCTPSRYQHMRKLVETAQLDNIVIERGTKDIFDAAALASQMDVLISPDTSFIHIASAFDIPTVAIYPNDPDHLIYWGPRSSRHVVIQPGQKDASIRGFSTENTVSAAIQLLNERIRTAT